MDEKKIVVNGHAGFCLSHAAFERYNALRVARGDAPLRKARVRSSVEQAALRVDDDLVGVVERLGAGAHQSPGQFRVVALPLDVYRERLWYYDEYDGAVSVHTNERALELWRELETTRARLHACARQLASMCGDAREELK